MIQINDCCAFKQGDNGGVAEKCLDTRNILNKEIIAQANEPNEECEQMTRVQVIWFDRIELSLFQREKYKHGNFEGGR